VSLKLRKLTEEDRARVSEWMAADEFHKSFSPDLFYAECSETLVFEDETGPILFVNLSPALRAFVQFAPNQAERTRVALPEAFAFVKGEARKRGFSEMLFESVSKPLIRFCKKRLGFQPSPHEHKTFL
jgi:hypothetical protein